jgi:Flp pilus assembly protein TadG
MLRLTQQRWWFRFRNEHGQAAFEFLLVLPMFILFLLLCIDFGVMMYEFVSVSNAAREGARYASTNCGSVGTCSQSLVQNRAASDSGGIVVTGDVTAGWLGTSRGSSIVVKVDHPYHFLFFPTTIHVTSCTDMRLEQTETAAVSSNGLTGC